VTTATRRAGGLEARLADLVASYDARADTGPVQFCLASPSRDWRWEWPSPGGPRQYFLASITKLYVAAIVMQLCAERRIDLDTAAAAYLGSPLMAGLHVLRGVDSSQRITVRELLSHTSGIADYFEQRRADGSSQFEDALRADFAWTLDDVLRITRQMSPRFAPSTPGHAHYSDTNYQLLGALIEAVTGTCYEQALQQRIIEPLGLDQTYPFTTATLSRYADIAPLLHGRKPVAIPRAMASVRADGGVVSTAREGLSFLQAFFGGALFPKTCLDSMQRPWRRIFYPLEYGMGIMRFALPRLLSPLRAAPVLVGHSGASGAVLFHAPDLDLYISGTVNQIAARSLAYRLMISLVFACQDAWR